MTDIALNIDAGSANREGRRMAMAVSNGLASLGRSYARMRRKGAWRSFLRDRTPAERRTLVLARALAARRAFGDTGEAHNAPRRSLAMASALRLL